MNVPTGTVTFLFSDIEGSTKLWENHPEQMRLALARHDELMRAAIESRRGHVFKTIGDAFCAAFDSAYEALMAASLAQQRLIAEPWPAETPIRVRIALHTGKAETRDNDYFGPTVNRVARLLATAHGGQTILSKAVTELVREHVTEDTGLRDLGEHRLKDLSQPEYVFQLLHPDLPSEFPPLRSLDGSRLPNNLPEQLTTFVGRRKEMEEVSGLLSRSRIVTLTGSGGCGKTRLAIQVAAENSERFPDGVWLVELASLSDPQLVPQTVASLLRVREEPGQTVLQTLTLQIRRSRLLLILDNCEHLLLACAQLAESILRICPEVKILATSREAFNIAGETRYRVPSLSLPDPKLTKDPQALEACDSVRLFVDRASAIVSDFSVTGDNAASLADLCRQLDGIPLAVELAAARVRSMSVTQIATRLDDRFRLLTGGSRTALPRQQTLRALVDWSYDLLSGPEQTLLRRLSVFAGGWTLPAAESVCSADPLDELDVMDMLSSLVDKSLVSFEQSRGNERYRLLETVRQYGREKIAGTDEESETQDRHIQWFSAFAARAVSWNREPDDREWMALLETEQDNLAAAMEMAGRHAEPSLSGQLALALGLMLQYRGFLNDAVSVVESGLRETDGIDAAGRSLRARLVYERAGLHQDFEESDLAEGLALSALDEFELMGDKPGIARCENLLGQIHMSAHEFAGAATRFDRSLSLFQQVGDDLGAAIVRNNQGVLARRNLGKDDQQKAGRLEEAKLALLEALEIRRKHRDSRGEAETLNNLGVVAFDTCDYRSAWKYYRDALEIERELRRIPGIATTLANLGEVAGVLGETEVGMRLLAVSERILQDIKSPLAGAVRSMLLDMSIGVTPDDLERLTRNATTLSLDASLDETMAMTFPEG